MRSTLLGVGISSDPLHISGVGYGDSFGVLVLNMMFFSVDLFVFLQVLGPLEGLFADLAHVGFQGSMYS